MKILLLSRYDRKGASSRIRTHQYLPLLRIRGIEVVTDPFFNDDYLINLYTHRKIDQKKLINSYIKRVKIIFSSKAYDMVWIEKEIFPWLPALLENRYVMRGRPLVIDYDDAIFHRYDRHSNRAIRWLLGNKAAAIARQADLIIGGNRYLCDYFRASGAPWVELLPSVIDLERYSHTNVQKSDTRFTIGWIGSPTTTRYLYEIADVLKQFICITGSRLLLVGSSGFSYDGLPVEIRQWSEESEVQDINEFDVGIMPLDNSEWSEGKCGYKLIQYMACAKPVIATETRANADIVRNGENGFLVKTAPEWESALWQLFSNASLRKFMGCTGRRMVEEQFCVQKTGDLLSDWLRQVHRKNMKDFGRQRIAI